MKLHIRIPKINFQKIYLTLFLFIIIFSPPFMPYPHLFFAVLSTIVVLVKYNKVAVRIMKTCGMYKWIIVFVILFLYTIGLPLIVSIGINDIVSTSNYISTINRFGVLLVTIVPTSIYTIAFLKSNDYDYRFFVESVINAGMLEAVFAIAALLNPRIKNIFVELMRKYSDESLYNNTWYITVRSFGFAGTLVDLFGLGVALISGCSFAYGLFEKKKKYIVYSFIIVVSALLNARTGVVLFGIECVIIIFAYVKRTGYKGVGYVLVFLIFMVWIVPKFMNFISTSNEATYSWIDSMYVSMKNFIISRDVSDNNKSDPIANLLASNTELPKGIRLMIGTGHSLYLSRTYRHSDIGYVNEIWLWGIIGCIYLYSNILKSLYKIVSSKNGYFSIMGVCVAICYFLFNFKAEALGYNPGVVVMFMVMFTLTYFINNNKVE